MLRRQRMINLHSFKKYQVLICLKLSQYLFFGIDSTFKILNHADKVFVLSVVQLYRETIPFTFAVTDHRQQLLYIRRPNIAVIMDFIIGQSFQVQIWMNFEGQDVQLRPLAKWQRDLYFSGVSWIIDQAQTRISVYLDCRDSDKGENQRREEEGGDGDPWAGINL